MDTEETGDVGLDLTDHVRLAAGVVMKAVERCNEEIYATIQPARALELQQAAKELSGLARDLVNEADRLLICSLDGDTKAVVGEKVVEVRRSYRRFDWDHARLAETVAIIALGGEVRTETKNIVDAFLVACRPEWRTTALRAMGLDANDYCSKELGRATVSVI